MGATTGQQLRDELQAIVAAGSGGSTNGATEKALADAVMGAKRRLRVTTQTDVAAQTFSVVLDPLLDFQMQITKVVIVPPDVNGGTPLTADDTNYATLTLGYNDGAGGSTTAIAARTTKITGGSGDWAKEQAVTLTITAANAIVPSGKQIQLNKTVTGTGVKIPAGTLVVVDGYIV